MSFDREKFEKLLFELELRSDSVGDDPSGLNDEIHEEVRSALRQYPEARKCYVKWQVLSHALSQDPAVFAGAAIDGNLDGIDDRGTAKSSDLLLPKRSTDVSTKAVARQTHSSKSSIGWAKLLAIASAFVALILGARVLYLESLRYSGGDVPDAKIASGGDSSLRLAAGNPRRSARALAAEDATIEQGEQTSSGLAIVTALVDATLGDDSQVVGEGSALSKGIFSLSEGNAQIEFFAGASVVLQGPAKIEVLDADRVRCLSGKMRAQVPPAARGFEVLTPDNRIVDLGTEFGVDVDGEETVLQVFDGEVEWHASQESVGEPELLTAGQAVTWNQRRGSAQLHSADPEGFLGLSDLQGEVQQNEKARFEQWRAFSKKLRKDPRLITYYAMDQAEIRNRKLRNSQDDRELDGAIVGARVASGRWGEKPALEFKHPADRVKVNVPGEFDSLSFMCWLRIDSLDRWYNSLFLTDSYQRGEPHWQVLDSGQLFFSVRVSRRQGGPEHRVVLSPVFWKPSMSGQWLHLATTYDVQERATSHYLNGELLSREEIPEDKVVSPTRIGLASIGNWSSPTKPDEVFAIRNLNGRMDEFMIFSEALSSDEIREIYSHGKP